MGDAGAVVFMAKAFVVANFTVAIFAITSLLADANFEATDFASVASTVVIIRAIMDMELAT